MSSPTRSCPATRARFSLVTSIRGSRALDSLAYLDACHAAEVPAAIERSRSGEGAHVWVFFEEAVPATHGALARDLAAPGGHGRPGQTGPVQLRLVLPLAGFMPKGSFGNRIALPLHGECLQRGTTAFLDPTTMRPGPDQWTFHSSVARLSAESTNALAESRRPVDAGPTLSLAALAKAGVAPSSGDNQGSLGGDVRPTGGPIQHDSVAALPAVWAGNSRLGTRPSSGTPLRRRLTTIGTRFVIDGLGGPAPADVPSRL